MATKRKNDDKVAVVNPFIKKQKNEKDNDDKEEEEESTTQTRNEEMQVQLGQGGPNDNNTAPEPFYLWSPIKPLCGWFRTRDAGKKLFRTKFFKTNIDHNSPARRWMIYWPAIADTICTQYALEPLTISPGNKANILRCHSVKLRLSNLQMYREELGSEGGAITYRTVASPGSKVCVQRDTLRSIYNYQLTGAKYNSANATATGGWTMGEAGRFNLYFEPLDEPTMNTMESLYWSSGDRPLEYTYYPVDCAFTRSTTSGLPWASLEGSNVSAGVGGELGGDDPKNANMMWDNRHLNSTLFLGPVDETADLRNDTTPVSMGFSCLIEVEIDYSRWQGNFPQYPEPYKVLSSVDLSSSTSGNLGNIVPSFDLRTSHMGNINKMIV